MSFFLSALGLMMVFEGIPYFCFPQKVKLFAQKLPEIPDSTLRVVGFFLMMIALATFAIIAGEKPGSGKYQAPRMENGRIAPPKFN